MSLEITIVRHGETLANKTNTIQGQTDVPLDEIGIQQANAAARALANEHFDAAYCSDLSRAVITCKTIVPNQQIIPLKELREWNLGEWQGMTSAEVRAKYPGGLENFRKLKSTWHAPGGETAEEINARICKFLSELPAKHPEGKIPIVSHCGPIRVMFQILCGGFDFPVLPQVNNASISRFLYCNGNWQLTAWNITTHLCGNQTLNGRY